MENLPCFREDKVVHFVCMGGCRVCYGWSSCGINGSMRRYYGMLGWGAVLCPIVMSGIIEILQEYCNDVPGRGIGLISGEYFSGDRRHDIRLFVLRPDCKGAKK